MIERLQRPFDLAGKRVWVAGHRGLVGGALTRRLAAENCEVLTATRGEVDLRRLDPMYRLVIGQENGPDITLDATSDTEEMAQRIAAIRLPPLEIPTPSPICLHSFCAIRMESPSFTAITESTWSSLTISGMNSSDTPWMRG